MYGKDLLRDTLDELLNKVENEVVEFKHASEHFDSRKLGKYFSALANEAGLKDAPCAWIVSGIDRHNGIQGSNYRLDRSSLDGLKGEVAGKTTNRITFIEIHELWVSGKRIVMFQIPPAPRGIPVAYEGHYYGRDGEELSPLNIEEIERIRLQSSKNDWSCLLIPVATMQHLEPRAISLARNIFKEKYKSNPFYETLDQWTDEQFLDKAKITINGKITNTAILLLGKPESVALLSPYIAEITWKLDTSDDQSYEHFGPPFLLTTTLLHQRIRNPNIKMFPRNELIATEVSKYETRVILEALHIVLHIKITQCFAVSFLLSKGIV